jgi:uncharacterized protein with von Willebrand factor type A (vWA) domain
LKGIFGLKSTKDDFDPFALASADFFNAAYEYDPRLVEACEDERRHLFVRQLLETGEFQALRAHTLWDEFGSTLVACDLAKQWVQLVEKAQPSDAWDKEVQSLEAVGKAIDKAKKEVKTLEDTRSAMGMGGDGSIPGQKVDAATLGSLFKRVKNGKALRRIIDLAGRYRRFAQAQQRSKTTHGMDDMVGVVQDGDPARLLPQELAMFSDTDLEDEAMRRLVERQCLCREFRGIERVAKGPVVVVVDESGSMQNEPIANAKAIALALAWVARHQRRWICLVGYSGGCKPNWVVMPPNTWNQTNVLDWLEHFYSGGTNRDVPIVELPKVWGKMGCPEGKTDIVMITDAICHLEDSQVKRWNDWREGIKSKCMTIVINQEPGDLTQVSDRVYKMKALSLNEEGVRETLSI